MKTVTAKGKTVEEAIQNALTELGTTADKVTTKVIDIPGTGLIGGMFGTRFAKVEVTMDDDENAICSRFLTDVFAAMNMEVSIDVKMDEIENEMSIDLKGDEMGVLIGKRGQTLDSLQYLTSLVVNKGNANYIRVKVDTENYRKRRKETLENLAKNLAYKVKRTKRPVTLEPMNPYERRVIHSALQNDKYVSTHSEGEEPFRKVVITLNK